MATSSTSDSSDTLASGAWNRPRAEPPVDHAPVPGVAAARAKEYQRHLDAWADTHEGYSVRVRVAVLRCEWCDYTAVADTKREAVAKYQREHEASILAYAATMRHEQQAVQR